MEYVAWAIAAVSGIGWFLDRFIFKGLQIKGKATENKAAALRLVQAERDELKRQLAEREKVEEGEGTDEGGAYVQGEEGSDSELQEDDSSLETSLPERSSTEESAESESMSEEGSSDLTGAIEALHEGKYDEGMELLEAHLADDTSEDVRIDWLAWGHFMAFRNGGVQRAFTELEHLAGEFPDNVTTQIRLSWAYDYCGETTDAIDHLEETLERYDEVKKKIDVAEELANLRLHSGQEDRAIEILKTVMRDVTTPSQKSALYAKAGEIYKEKGSVSISFKMYERALYHNPTDTRLRFQVAYAYGNNSAPKMALYHYIRLLEIDGEANVALNNAGFMAHELSLPITSIRYHQESAQLDYSYAAACLAERYVNAGFEEEAEDILQSALEKEEVHPYVHHTMDKLYEQRQEEEEKIKGIEEEIEQAQELRRDYAAAVLQEVADVVSLSGVYDGEPGELKIEVQEDGELTGELSLPRYDRIAQVTGTVKGSGVKISWELPPKEEKTESQTRGSSVSGMTPSINVADMLTEDNSPRSESGFLIFEGGCLAGYTSREGESLDPEGDLKRRTDWDLQKQMSEE